MLTVNTFSVRWIEILEGCSTLFISREMKQNDRKISDNYHCDCVAKKYTLSSEHVFCSLFENGVICQNLIWQTSKKVKSIRSPRKSAGEDPSRKFFCQMSFLSILFISREINRIPNTLSVRPSWKISKNEHDTSEKSAKILPVSSKNIHLSSNTCSVFELLENENGNGQKLHLSAEFSTGILARKFSRVMRLTSVICHLFSKSEKKCVRGKKILGWFI
jgi:hypothetical protein